MQPQHLIAGGVALLIAVASGVWFGGKPSDPEPIVIERSVSAPGPTADGSITVHVSGAVAQPGLVQIASGGRVADALAAAGGALPSADLTVLNLAAPLSDGLLIVVVEQGSNDGLSGLPTDGRVRVNAATAEELSTLPGIGPVLAQRIADYRDANGPFGTVEDLLDVPGIGEGKLATMRDAVAIP